MSTWILDAPPWRVLSASVRGASHESTDTPNQDAVQSQAIDSLGQGALVVAVADGHGHWRHFRSRSGSRFAVDVACRSIDSFSQRLLAIDRPDELEVFAEHVLVPNILDGWKAAVANDVESSPFTPVEEELQTNFHDGPESAYGSTLLIAVSWNRWVLLLQIGDGDIVALLPGGDVLLPMPVDLSLDGHHTSSLCQAAAARAFRVSVIDQTVKTVFGILMATDGYGNAQAIDQWEPAVGSDLVNLLRSHGTGWVADQLPAWLAQCASSDGSGDDTTVALLVAEIEGDTTWRNANAETVRIVPSAGNSSSPVEHQSGARGSQGGPGQSGEKRPVVP